MAEDSRKPKLSVALSVAGLSLGIQLHFQIAPPASGLMVGLQTVPELQVDYASGFQLWVALDVAIST